MIYIEARLAEPIIGASYEAVKKAVKRGSAQYSHLYIDGKGRGGKKLLIGVSEEQLGEAISGGMSTDGVDLYDDAGVLCDIEARNAVILNSNLKKEDPKETAAMPDMKPYLNAAPEARLKALLRMEAVDAYEHRDKRLSAIEFIESLDERFDPIGVSENKLFRWKRAVEEARRDGISPLVALLDGRGRSKGTVKMDEEMQEMAVRMHVRRDNPLRVSAIYQNMLLHYGGRMCSYDVLNNFLKQWKRQNASLYAFAQNADKWKNSRMAGFGSLSEKAKYPNHYWELDSTPADLICSDGKRYAILGAIDVYSRRVCFWVDERSSSYSISRLLRKAILKMGIPDHVVIDNGKDYQSNHFDSIAYNLGIQKETVPPFSGDMKPHIERMFRRLSGELFEELEGYIGHSVAERNDIESRRGFAHKIESKAKWFEQAKEEEKRRFVDSFSLKASNLGLEVKVPVDAAKLQQLIDGWVENLYEKTEHKGLGKSPLAKWSETFMPVKSVSDPRMLDILLGESHVRTVGKKGIRLDGALYQSVRLAEYVGEQVRIMTDDDMGRVYVYAMNYAPICIAEDYDYTGKSRAELAEGKRISHRIAREYAKLLEEWEEASRMMDPSIKDRIEAASGMAEVLTSTIAVAKSTESTRALMEASKVFSAQDQSDAEESNIMNMQGEKLTPSGRPQFAQLVDRFVWDLENDRVDESTEKLRQKKPELWDIAYREYERRKIG